MDFTTKMSGQWLIGNFRGPYKWYVLKANFLSKITFQNCIFHKSNIFFKYQIQVTFWIKSVILPQCGFRKKKIFQVLTFELNFLAIHDRTANSTPDLASVERRV